jgi:RNA polymerase sigma-70 factor (ECF subfamily)
MDEKNQLAAEFEAERPRLQGVAFRMLGSLGEAEDAVQNAWLKVSRADTGEVGNLRGWLTTVVARVCLDMLRARKARHEQPIGDDEPEPAADYTPANDPEVDLLTADAMGVALLVVLEALTPAERVAFVLHDMFDLPFDEIAPIVGRSPDAARQLASRARRRVRGAPATPAPDRDRRRLVVQAFLAAARSGDFEGLMAVLDPDVEFRADAFAQKGGQAAEMHGATAVAEAFKGRAQAARPAEADGAPALAVILGGQLRVVVRLTVVGDRIAAMEAVADPERIAAMKVEMLEG